jgi:hypothetical protein
VPEQVQEPALQTSVESQALPHEPQLFKSV